MPDPASSQTHETPPAEASGRPDRLTHDQSRARRPPTPKRLRRSRDRVVAGIAGGVAAYIGADPRKVRWLFGVVTVLSGGVFLIAYALLWLLLPAPASSNA